MTHNLTVGSPLRVIIAFTLPLLVGNLFQQLYAFTDAAVVGQLLGVNALAAVGASGSLHFLLIGFTFGASAGLGIPVARAFGAGDLAAMRRHVAAGIMVSGGIALAITALGELGARPMLRLLGTPPELLPAAATFLTVTFWGAGATMAFNYLAAVIRALGDSRTPLYFLILSCLLNAGLVVFFIGVLGFGVGGAALATVIAQLTAVAACLALIARRMPALRLRRRDWDLRPGELAESARYGLTMGFQFSVIAIGAVVLQTAINRLGADAVAATTAAMRVDQLAVAPLASFGAAITTFVAQNRGARQWRRIRVGVFRTVVATWVLAAALGALIIGLGTPIVQLFVGAGEQAVVAMAHQYLAINCALYPLLASLFVLRNAIQGLGSTGVPMLAGFMELVFRAAAGLFLVGSLGFVGVAVAAPLAWVGALVPVVAAWFVHRGHLLERERGALEPYVALPALAAA
ncbi:MAG: MATE family efflux transporter [Actinobacteria bacterium]|nr:MATE family efflux transporter [Actinomycetota bacterium]